MDVFLGMVGGEAVRRKPQKESNIFFTVLVGSGTCFCVRVHMRTCATRAPGWHLDVAPTTRRAPCTESMMRHFVEMVTWGDERARVRRGSPGHSMHPGEAVEISSYRPGQLN